MSVDLDCFAIFEKSVDVEILKQKGAKLELKAVDRYSLFGNKLPSWTASAMRAASFAYSLYSAYQERLFQQQLFGELAAIREQLIDIEASLNRLHHKVDEILYSLSYLKKQLKNSHHEASFDRCLSFYQQWQLGFVSSPDNDIFYEDFKEFRKNVHDVLTTSKDSTMWLSMNIPRVNRLLMCFLACLPRYARVRSSKYKEASSESEIYGHELAILSGYYHTISNNYNTDLSNAKNKFLKIWSQGNPFNDNFGMAASSKRVKAHWRGRGLELSPHCIVPKGEFLRKRQKHNMHFRVADISTRSGGGRRFRMYQRFRLGDDMTFIPVGRHEGLFFMPEQRISASTNPFYDKEKTAPSGLFTTSAQKVDVWQKSFSFAVSKNNKRRHKEWKRAGLINDLQNEIKSINEEWRTYILLSINRPLIDIAINDLTSPVK